MLQTLVAEFRRGERDSETSRTVLQNPFKMLQLDRAIGIRSSVLKYVLPLDEDLFETLVDDVRRSAEAARRLGHAWMPSDAKSIERKEASDDNWATLDELKVLNDVCTRWCTRKYFPNAFARVNMVANVIRLYDCVQRVGGLRYKIVFKGGVMIRLVLLEFVNDLPPDARRSIIEYLDQTRALSISDFDFEIVADRHDPSDASVHRYIAINYAVLLWLLRAMQRELAAGVGERLLSLRWNEEKSTRELQEALQAAVDAMEPASALHGAHIDRVVLGGTVQSPPVGYQTRSGRNAPAPRRNVVVFDCGATKCVLHAKAFYAALGVDAAVPSTAGGDRLYATLNTYIGEEQAARPAQSQSQSRADHLRGVFHLARIKHAFVVYYTTRDGEKRCDRLGGEMIDLSQSHGERLDHLRRALYGNVPIPYQDYPILGVREVALRSYSMEGFLFDHMAMLHHTDLDPWNVKKKEKRIVRYVCFFVACVLAPTSSTEPYAAKLQQLKRLVRAMACTPEFERVANASFSNPTIARFVARERRALLRASEAEAHQHLSNLRAPLSMLLKVFQAAPPSTSRVIRIVDAHWRDMRAHLRHLDVNGYTRACHRVAAESHRR